MKKLFFGKRSGQGLVEYILIVALIAIFAIAALKIFGKKVGTSFKNTAETVEHEVGGAKSAGESAAN